MGTDNEKGRTVTLGDEHRATMLQAFMTYEAYLAQAHVAAFTKYASLALQGAFLLNGSVGVAAFSSRAMGSVWPLVLCAAGAICAVFGAGVAYLAQKAFLALDLLAHTQKVREFFQVPDPEGETHKRKATQGKCRYLLFLCMALFLFSLALFVV